MAPMMHQSMIGLANYLTDGGQDGNARLQESGNCCRCERPNWINAMQRATVATCKVNRETQGNFALKLRIDHGIAVSQQRHHLAARAGWAGAHFDLGGYRAVHQFAHRVLDPVLHVARMRRHHNRLHDNTALIQRTARGRQ